MISLMAPAQYLKQGALLSRVAMAPRKLKQPKTKKKDAAIISQLEELARNLSIDVRYESIKKEGSFSAGGLCRLKEEWIIIVNAQAPGEDKIQTLAEALNHFDLSRIFMKPELREFLERISLQAHKKH